MNLKDLRPYVFWAHIQWLEESGAKPHLVLQNGPKTMLPLSLRAHSAVTFNISEESVRELRIDENGLSFLARFSGKEYQVFAPLDCVLLLRSEDGLVQIALHRETNLQASFQQETKPKLSDLQRSVLRDVNQSIIESVLLKPTLAAVGNSDG